MNRSSKNFSHESNLETMNNNFGRGLHISVLWALKIDQFYATNDDVYSQEDWYLKRFVDQPWQRYVVLI